VQLSNKAIERSSFAAGAPLNSLANTLEIYV